MIPGDIVQTYTDPIANIGYIGDAKLKRFIKSFRLTNNFQLEFWEVEYLNRPGVIVEQLINNDGNT